jgi:hypothetical protein
MQSIGRKRQVNPQDKATLHIRDYSQNQIDDAIDRNSGRFEYYNFYQQRGELEYLKAYRKRYHDKNDIMVFDYRLDNNGIPQPYLKIDKFVLTYYEYQKKIFKEIKKASSYAKYLKDKLQIADDVKIRHKKKDDYIDSRLKAIAAEGKIYTYKNLKELTTKLNIPGNNRMPLKSAPAINKRLQEMGKPYIIETTEDEQRHKHYKFIYIEQM